MHACSMVNNSDSDTPRGDFFYCGCLRYCQRKSKLWRPRKTWYNHREQREAEIASGAIPRPTGARAVVPSKKHTLRDGLQAIFRAPKRDRYKDADSRTGQQGTSEGSGSSSGLRSHEQVRRAFEFLSRSPSSDGVVESP